MGPVLPVLKEILISLDLPYNQLEGPLPNGIAIERASPEAFQNNRGLYGNSKGLHTCDSFSAGHGPTGKIVIMVVVMVFVIGLVGILCLLKHWRSSQRERLTKHAV